MLIVNYGDSNDRSGHSRGNAYHVGADLPVSCPWIVTIVPIFTPDDPTGSRGNRQRDAITQYLFNHRFTNQSVKPASRTASAIKKSETFPTYRVSRRRSSTATVSQAIRHRRT